MFYMNRVLVIGATGSIGRHVVSQLSAGGAQVRAMARNPDAAGLPPQVEVKFGDLTRPDTLEPCLHGIDTVFLLWVAAPGAIAPALERIFKHVQRIVFLSAPLKTLHPFFQQPNPIRAIAEQIERQIEASGLQWTFLRPGMFAGNALRWWAPQIRAGDLVRWPYLAAPTAPIDERDIAAIAVRALCENGHAGAEYVITGPESLTQQEQLTIIGRTIGCSLRIEEIPPDDWQRYLPGAAPKMLLDAWAAAIGQPAYVTSTFADLTGTSPRTFFEWATDHAAEFRA
jgi:uncharacterized protein YbjT (DUF2867 family)